MKHFGPPSPSKALPLFTCTSMLAFGSDTPFKWVERAIEFVGQPGRRRCPCLLPTAKYAARAAAMPSSSTSTRAILLPGARPSAWLNSSQSMGCFAPVAAGSAAARLLLRRSTHLRRSACSRSLLDCSVNRASRQSAFMRALRSHFFLIIAGGQAKKRPFKAKPPAICRGKNNITAVFGLRKSPHLPPCSDNEGAGRGLAHCR